MTWTGLALARRIERGLCSLENLLAALSLLSILGISLAGIVARNVWHSGFPGAEGLMRHLVLWVMLIGAMLAVAQGRHIRVDVATLWLSPQVLRRLVRPIMLLSSVICMYLADAAWDFWHEEWQLAGEPDRLVTLMLAILPIGFVLMAVHFLLRAWIGPSEQEAVS